MSFFTEDQLSLISSGDITGNFVIDNNVDYIRMTVFQTQGMTFSNRVFYSNKPLISNQDINEITIYQNDQTGAIFVKPNEILDINLVPSGNYTLQFDFLRNIFNNVNHVDGSGNGIDLIPGDNPRFYIAEISPSRKEVRLYGRMNVNSQITFTEQFRENFFTKIYTSLDSDGNSAYGYDHILGVSDSRNLTIVNFQFDTVSNSENVSLVVRLNNPLPADVRKLDECFIAKELFDPINHNIIYISDITETIIGGPLTPDSDFEHDNNINFNSDGFQNKDELFLSSSLSETNIEDILYQLKDKNKNLNIDYNDFSNHTFFGSAEEKIKNFRTKFVELNDYFGEISHSLSTTGSNSGSFVVSRRQELFEKVREVYENFTPYERWLYIDGQSFSTASAPGVGKNYVKEYALNKVIGYNIQTTADATGSEASEVTSSKLSNYDGFSSVYVFNTKGSDESDLGIDNTTAKVFDGVYLAEEPPFFNYSGSVYISFLMRSDAALVHKNQNQNYNNDFYSKGVMLPEEALSTASVGQKESNIYATSSEYRRYTFEASQSHWRAVPNMTLPHPNIDGENVQVGNIAAITDNNFGADALDSVLGYNIFGDGFTSFPPGDELGTYQMDSHGQFGSLLHPQIYDENHNLNFEQPRSQSYVLPAGDLFSLQITSSDGDAFNENANTASYITDIKVTYNNPSSSLPFSSVYHTGSDEWKSWYSGSIDSASAFDEINIHSFKNNLPEYIKVDSNYDDLRLFLDMIGEQYDNIRNYIDNYSSFYNTNYKNSIETGSKQLTAPDNVLPMIAANFGWEFINPYTGSLEEYFIGVSDGGTNVKEIRNETWRKVLNNLIYIYKTKGTLNSVNALLNTYGYPENSLRIQELGGSSEEINPEIITNETKPMEDGMFRQTGNIHYVKKDSTPFYSFDFTGQAEESPSNQLTDKKLHLDWYTNNADGNTIEFVFKGTNISGSTQVLVENSGSGTLTGSSTLWDLRLLPKGGSSSISASLELRINNSRTGALDINTATNKVSMSTDFLPLTNNKLWNVMVQRVTGSVTNAQSQSYRIYTGLQQGDKITYFTSASMTVENSVSSSGLYANENFIGTGSLTTAPSSASSNISGNLIIGRTLTGSMAEFRNWSEILSASKFKQHILNKFSFVGNSLTSSIDNLVYRFRLNENYPSASMASNIVDANPDGLATTPTDYTRDMNVATGSYVLNYISTIGFSTRIDIHDQKNSNKSAVKPEIEFIRPLNPVNRSVRTVYDKPKNQSKPKRAVSKNIQIVKSISERIDDYTINKFSDFDLTDFIGDPQNQYSSSYKELDDFREKAHKGIKVDTNRYIESQKHIFNNSIISNLTSLLPASSNQSNVGIQINSPMLHRNKHKYYIPTVNTESIYTGNIFHMYYEESGSLSGSYNKDLYIFNLSESAYIQPYTNKNPFYMYQHESGSIQEYLYTFTQSSFTEPYNPINPIHFGGADNSGSYFNIITGSYFAQYNMKKPLYMYGKDSGSVDDYAFKFTGSLYNALHEPLTAIHFGGADDSGSYFNIITGSYFAQYNMRKPLYMTSKYNETGSRDDYLFDMTGSSILNNFHTHSNMLQHFYNPITSFGSSSIKSIGTDILTASSVSASLGFTIKVPDEVGGQNETITVTVYDHPEFTGSVADRAVYVLKSAVAASGSNTDVLFTTNLLNLFNGTTGSSVVKYGTNVTSSEGFGIQGVSASLGSSTTNITLFADSGSSEGNSIVLANHSGSIYQTSVTMDGGQDAKQKSFENTGLFNMTGSRYFSQYDLKKPIYIYSKYNETGSKDDYLFDMSGSKYMSIYESIESIYFVRPSGSYFYKTTGSYFAQYNVINPIYFGGADDSGSYFNIVTGSHTAPYNMRKSINIYDKTSGSRDDYAFNMTESNFSQPYTSSNVTEVSDIMGLFNADRRFRDGTQFTKDAASNTNRSYIWNAWGTGSDDVWFMNGTSSQGGYYNQDFEYKVIGDMEIWSSSFYVQGTGSNHHGLSDISRLDYSNIHTFKNKIIIDTGKGFSHKALTPTGSDVNSVSETRFVDGRPMGRTHYFVTSSTGDILYPPNHYIIAGTSKNSFGEGTDHMNSLGYVGSQYPIPSDFEVIRGGVLVDPLGLAGSHTGSVVTVKAVGASTEQAIKVIKQGGIQTDDPKKSG